MNEKNKKLKKMSKSKSLHKGRSSQDKFSDILEKINNISYKDDIIFDESLYAKFLGQGGYGSCYKVKVKKASIHNKFSSDSTGTYINACLKSPPNENSEKQLMNEAKIYNVIEKDTTPHYGKEFILKFYGVAKKTINKHEQFYCLILELGDHSLYTFLHQWEKTYADDHFKKQIYTTNNSSDPNFFIQYPTDIEFYSTLHYYHKYELCHIFYWVKQINDGLMYLKLKNFVHRDLKTKNIIMFDQGRLLKICDLGTAKPNEDQMTNDIGTYSSMAPEIMKVNSKRFSNITTYDFRCDIYSLGIIFWTMLTRCRVFANVGEGNAIYCYVLDGNKPEEILGLPPIIETILKRMIDHVPENRISGEQISKAMSSFLSVYDEKDYLRPVYEKVILSPDDDDEDSSSNSYDGNSDEKRLTIKANSKLANQIQSSTKNHSKLNISSKNSNSVESLQNSIKTTYEFLNQDEQPVLPVENHKTSKKEYTRHCEDAEEIFDLQHGNETLVEYLRDSLSKKEYLTTHNEKKLYLKDNNFYIGQKQSMKIACKNLERDIRGYSDAINRDKIMAIKSNSDMSNSDVMN